MVQKKMIGASLDVKILDELRKQRYLTGVPACYQIERALKKEWGWDKTKAKRKKSRLEGLKL
jgi:hypothetical protein